METLFELESLFAWLSNKVEIHSVFITSEDSLEGQKNLFSCGYSIEKLCKYNQNQVQKLTDKLSHLVHSMQNLPQTFVCDLREGASNIACEFAIGADIRIANESCSLEFDHNKLGLVPSSGGMSTLALMVGQLHSRNFLLTGKRINADIAKTSGFVFETYTTATRTNYISDLLSSINKQAPVQRIQTKLGIFDLERINYEQSMKIEKQISKAGMMSEDWKKVKVHFKQENEIKDDFLPAKSMSYATKLTLVDTDQSPDLTN
jgi:enoyl-CoA hydratase/carnithine racemase